MKMTFEEWLELNEENMYICFAETGADRELDFDVENELEKCYQEIMSIIGSEKKGRKFLFDQNKIKEKISKLIS